MEKVCIFHIQFKCQDHQLNVALTGRIQLCVVLSALRIHISEATKEVLDDLGGYEVEERGEVFLKVSKVTSRCSLRLL